MVITVEYIKKMERFLERNSTSNNPEKTYNEAIDREVKKLKRQNIHVDFTQERMGDTQLNDYLLITKCVLRHGATQLEASEGTFSPHAKYAALIKCLKQLIGEK